MSPIAKCFLVLIRDVGAGQFARMNRAQLGAMRPDEKRELWAALSPEEKDQVEKAMRDYDAAGN